MLSLVTPPSIRSVVTNPNEVGSAAGQIFAWGTFGSLAGNYLAGFVLLALLGVRTIVNITSVSLLLLSVVTWLGGRRWSSDSKPAELQNSIEMANEPSGTSVPGNATWFWQALLIVFACSFVTGALEGAAFRILAPLVGVSMFLSAGVVGVILAGMSFGNALGGNLASRYGSHQALRWSLMVSGIATLAVAPLWKLAVSSGLFHQMSLIPQILCWSFSLFFLPALAFGDSGCGERFFSAISSDDGRIQLADSATAAASGRVSSNRDRCDGIRPLYGLGCADRRKIVW
jgi:hypothetical protein